MYKISVLVVALLLGIAFLPLDSLAFGLDTELDDGTFQLKIDPPPFAFTVSYDRIQAWVYYASTASSTTAVEYIHPDHLGSTGAVTNSTGTPLSTVSYYPYGQERINSGSDATDRHYIGQRTDSETNLSYLQNRYYASNRGVFLNQDPVFWEVGKTSDGKKIMLDPQSANSYGYARSNPIINKDPSGRYAETGFDVAMLAVSVNAYRNNPSISNAAAVLLDGASVGLPFFPAIGGWAIRGANAAGDAARAADNASGAYKTAVEGGKHAGMIPNYSARTASEIQKGISSLQKQIDLHIDKINNPTTYIPNWSKLDTRRQDALIQKVWPAEIRNYSEQKNVLQGIQKSKAKNEK